MDRSRHRRSRSRKSRKRSHGERAKSINNPNDSSNRPDRDENYTQLLEHRVVALETLLNSRQSQNLSENSRRSPAPIRSRSSSAGASRNNKQRFVGRTELIPKFDGTSDSLTVRQWLRKIDSVAQLYNWDDRAKIFAVIDRLSGNAKSWYDCQTDIESNDWDTWKEKLISAFPSSKGIAANLKEFVNIERKSNEDVVSFYYAKLKLGKHCELPDHVIADVIISTLNDSIMKASAYAAGCRTTGQLLQFLTEYNSNTSNNSKETKRQHTLFRADNSKKGACFVCGKTNHKAANCTMRKSEKNAASPGKTISCTFCKRTGHVRENGFKLKARPSTTEKVSLVVSDDAKYHLTAKINNINVPAFIDFGSACNIIKAETAKALNLPGECVARGIPVVQGQSKAEVLAKPDTLPKDIVQRLQKLLDQYKDCFADNNSELVQLSINGTVNATTGYAPSELLYGFRPKLKFDLNLSTNLDNNQVEQVDKVDRRTTLNIVRAKAADKINKSAIAMKRRYDKNRDPAIVYHVGDMVMIEKTPIIKGLTSGKLVQRYIGPVVVKQVLPNDRYKVESLSRDRRRFRGVVASDKMKLFRKQTVD
ncbi:hypothetical protein NQ315_008274 [Exocentrus adspersus]|uniref:CCHC-type domain-containing protein n=1 Tax=Exocentrus adspersus TaxID=1586481 RepID=A0AAV8VM91_9CUCU|nr:hypothetical protein NQ315_008274 [Exocentrus adspersus]